MYGTVHKYTSPWSLPAKIESVEGNVCIVELWGNRGRRQVPCTLIRKLQGEVPVSLAPLNTEQLDIVSRKELPKGTIAPAQRWDTWLGRAKRSEKEREEVSKKRRLLSSSPRGSRKSEQGKVQ